ncbi:MAG: phosphoribosylaminoimidazolesuccinocarboxamide synthase [Pauljensenia sp.]
MPASPHGWIPLASGKVRDIYVPDEAVVGEPPQAPPAAGRPRHAKPGPEALLMVTSDRISAYDYVLPTLIPGKGAVLNQLAIWWMGKLRPLVENHLLDVGAKAPAEAAQALAGAPTTRFTVPAEFDGRAVVCRSLHMIPIECVVRGYLTGSGLEEYRRSGTVCGLTLPEGLTEASRLDEPIFTPAAKADMGSHDENISFERAADLVGEEIAVAIRDLSIALYKAARDIAAERGIIIADTKFEFGIDVSTGALVLADEILTPDSSRFWPAHRWVEGEVTPSYDKQYVRDWLTSTESGWDRASGDNPPALPDSVVAATTQRYVEVYRLLTGADPIL